MKQSQFVLDQRDDVFIDEVRVEQTLLAAVLTQSFQVLLVIGIRVE